MVRNNNQEFYRVFEDRHRGSRELIMGRLEVYLPFIEKLKAAHKPCTALDLGCGRGEWLQLLQNHGVQARGVDLDNGMLQACWDQSLQAEQTDAIEALQMLPDNSLSVISGFHIVEHIAFSQVKTLVEEALRVLQPSGLLILETPNAENLIVGTHNFYLDPTHLRPLPHTLLAFVTELTGFIRNKVLRLQEDPALHQQQRLGLMQVLAGVSPDYAVVAQKPADIDTMAEFDVVFSQEYGISIKQIADRYDQALNEHMETVRYRMEELLHQEEELRLALAQTNERLAKDEHHARRFHDALRKVELRSAQLETLANQLRQQMLQSLQRAHQEESRAREAESALREAIVQVAKLDARYDAAQDSNQSLASQSEELNKEFLELTRHHHRLEVQFSHGQEKITDLKQKLQKNESQIQQQKQEQSDLQEQLAAATDTIATLNEQAENAAELWTEEQSRLSQKLQSTQEQLNESLGKAHHGYQRATELGAELEATKTELNSVHQSNHNHLRQFQKCSEQLEYTTQQLNESLGNAHNWYLRAIALEQDNAVAQQHINNLRHSTSWRITAPLRGVSRLIAWLLTLPFRVIKATVRPLVKGLLRYALQRPGLRQRWTNRLRAYPWMFAHLRQFALNRGLIVTRSTSVHAQTKKSEQHSFEPQQLQCTQQATVVAPDLDALTPRAKQIYQDLKAAIETNEEQR